MSRLLYVLHALLALLGLALATHLKDPHLLPVRAYEAPIILLVAAAGLLVALRQARGWRWPYLSFVALWLATLMLTGFHEYEYRSQKQMVLTAAGDDADRLLKLGEHLVIGYDNMDDVRELVQRGFVSGLFVTQRNAKGKSFEQLRQEIAAFQILRREAGLPPLIIATDQEGGPVSRLSPPLPRQPPLATLLAPGLSDAEIETRATAYGAEQGKALGTLGVNMNFSPVVDLMPDRASGALDLHTRIAERAIAKAPEVVARVALGYSRGLLSQGVVPTVKHFPGLGSVAEDTHNFDAHLTLPRNQLAARDWQPFRVVLEQTPALLMVGHVILDTVDPKFPASLSKKVLTDVVRNEMKFDGIAITDDMTMAAAYNRGICQSAVDSLNADMDLLLLSYDWEKAYTVLACLLKKDRSGELKNLQHSGERLNQLPWRQAMKSRSATADFRMADAR